MLLTVAVAALIVLWWVGRNGMRFPAGVTPTRVAAYAMLAGAGILLLRGAIVPAGILGLGGVWLLQGGTRTARWFRELVGGAPAEPVRTATIEFDGMRDGVPADGTVLAGPLIGRRLSETAPFDLTGLLALCREADPAAAAPLEAYLDRRHPSWRIDAERDADPRPGGPLQPGPMTEQEAYQILGLQRGATLEEVRAAHRRLMKRFHPDQGGSAEGAARLNAARDRLTNRHR